MALGVLTMLGALFAYLSSVLFFQVLLSHKSDSSSGGCNAFSESFSHGRTGQEKQQMTTRRGVVCVMLSRM